MKSVKIIRQTKQATLSQICCLYDLKRDAYYKYVERFVIK